ncbi:probable chromo domain-containing protein LHP1 [Coccinella septempunctata]|uniref:probable chromo domain-containing protein LHP1 n=1 Tax=Coccinella septempunctata TaxID=41139 RepID=UPI001D099D42|nr:probable chromo domain-containing protein LHP1 [Coccinella septempunctata]
MKRRSGNWNKSNTSQGSGTDAEESNSFTSEDDNQENGDDSSVDLEPKEKRRRTKGKKDSSPEKKSIAPKKRPTKGRKTKESEPENGKNDNKDVSEEDNEEEVTKKNVEKKSGRGRKSKEKQAPKQDSEDKNEEEEDSGLNDEEEEYEVESVVDEKTIKGIRYYLIRWKGYGEESDTWEPASTLNCPEALQEYRKKKSNTKSPGDKSKKVAANKVKKTLEPQEWDENEDFEVVRILDVHFKRDGKREFLVAWKGFSQKYDSWEPEENMNCKDLIEKFLKKCNQAKEANPKELRVMRKTTDRFTLSTNDTGRRLSKRNQGKQRVHYHDAE